MGGEFGRKLIQAHIKLKAYLGLPKLELSSAKLRVDFESSYLPELCTVQPSIFHALLTILIHKIVHHMVVFVQNLVFLNSLASECFSNCTVLTALLVLL